MRAWRSTCRPAAATKRLGVDSRKEALDIQPPRPASRSRGGFFVRPWQCLVVVSVLVVLMYLPGLSGPFLFDDPANILKPMQPWLLGETGWLEILLGNRSGIFGRPLSMLSFLANGAMTGLAVTPFKVTNLVIHLLCGSLIYLLLARLLPRDPVLQHRACWIAVLVATLWLLHPMQVSTVLYVVQRMAQLSALFTLVALLFFVIGRQALEQGHNRAGWTWLFLLLPCATLAALLSKENGALVPLLCGVIELGYFARRTETARPWPVKVFFGLTLLLPGIAALYRYGLHPHVLTDSYDGRLFTLGERLLSQPRAIMDYLGALLLPRGPSLGIYTDDFVVSHSLLDPPTTLFALLGLIALVGFAWWSRARNPAIFTGIGLYLAGHVMESTVFPLEMYFEHRNYLPSFGVFLALAGIGAWLLPPLLSRSSQPRQLQRILGVSLALVVCLLAVGAWARAGVWSSWPLLAEQGVREHPNSRRARLDQISILLSQSRNDEALQAFAQLGKLDDPSARNSAAMGTVWLQCRLHGRIDADSVAQIAEIVGQKLQLAELLSAEQIMALLLEQGCEGLSRSQFAQILRDATNAAGQNPGLTQIWRNRLVAARLFVADNQMPLAIEQGALAWMPGTADAAAGVFLANLYYATGDYASARLIVRDVEPRIATWDRRNREQLSKIRKQFEAGQPPPMRPNEAPKPVPAMPADEPAVRH